MDSTDTQVAGSPKTGDKDEPHEMAASVVVDDARQGTRSLGKDEQAKEDKQQSTETSGGKMSSKQRKMSARPDDQTNDEETLSDGSEARIFCQDLPIGMKKTERTSFKRMKQHAHHLHVTESRMTRLEHRVNELSKRPPSPEPADKKPKKQAAIPQSNAVYWSEFKEWRNRKKPHYAIDILLGDPVLYHHRHDWATGSDSNVLEHHKAEIDWSLEDSLPERIRINSIPLLRLLRRIIGEDFDSTSDLPVVMLRPFKALIYHRGLLHQQLTRYNGGRSPGMSGPELPAKEPEISVPELDNPNEAMADLECLLKFLDECHTQISRRLQNNDQGSRPKVQYSDLWFLFKPGTIIVANHMAHTIWRVLQVTPGRPYLVNPINLGHSQDSSKEPATYTPFTLDCYYIDYDGKKWGPYQHRFSIEPFDGVKEVDSLDIYPVDYCEQGANTAASARKRGNLFVEASKISHMYYKGRTVIDHPNGQPIKNISHVVDIDSPVMVDFDRTLQFNPEWRLELGWQNMFQAPAYETREMTINWTTSKCGNRVCTTVYCCANENIAKDSQWDRRRSSDFLKERNQLQRTRKLSKDDLLDEEIVLLPSRVYGFVLRSRKWANLHVNDLKPVPKDDTGFDGLEINSGHKRVILGLVRNHYRRKDGAVPDQDDFGFDLVKAKGKGLIFLLHGAPGVGKTSTAECVAALQARPLFPITCGDLGMTPTEVESNLEFNFQLAESWGCVLLLDEADVFLAERSKGDVQRNALVSVFLRALEYYGGILFLTTNRVGTIDEAFRSRIHVNLLYLPLDQIQTDAIWSKHLTRLIRQDKFDVDKEGILAYAQELWKEQKHAHGVAWNGRQIRNAFQTAVALAEQEVLRPSDRPSLNRGSFEIVAKASVDFEKYIQETLGKSTVEYVGLKHLRTDNYEPGADAFGTFNSAQVPASTSTGTYHSGVGFQQQQSVPFQGHGAHHFASSAASYGNPASLGHQYSSHSPSAASIFQGSMQSPPSNQMAYNGAPTTLGGAPTTQIHQLQYGQQQLMQPNGMTGVFLSGFPGQQPSGSPHGLPVNGMQQVSQPVASDLHAQKQMEQYLNTQSNTGAG
ncbi:hypothetical protein BDV96DRAFT_328093 [Lophiotrema nucula]|uniref:AAA+ ATPase domain-containing protein n=1 Tax=Lophiotrema nucula TaxID=690887 RepID=A0A6A5YIT8_9PLEO|nr:hypothetical protein BDV96DRAFT_328093 [Lophiotrema nucula]